MGERDLRERVYMSSLQSNLFGHRRTKHGYSEDDDIPLSKKKIKLSFVNSDRESHSKKFFGDISVVL